MTQGHLPIGDRLCEACGEPLGAHQRPGARYHGGGCRAVATRARRRAEVVARLDALAEFMAEFMMRGNAELAALRAQLAKLG